MTCIGWRPPLRVELTGPADCRIWDDGELVAEVQALALTFFRTKRGEPAVIGSTVPLPLYWQQYADHEQPERNLSSSAGVVAGSATALTAEIICTGATASGAARSTFRIRFAATEHGAYAMHAGADLHIVGAAGWLVTPNPHHGELEFCDLWPERTFLPGASETKRYHVHAIRRDARVVLIRHHHLESEDKHNILMREGDEAAWLLEEENPVVRIDSSPEVAAGLCAYMWDMHFAYKVCRGMEPVILPRGFRAEAQYTLRSIARADAELWMRVATTARPKGLDEVPVHVRGVQKFTETFANADLSRTDLWPWAFEVLDRSSGEVIGAIDTTTGFDDDASLVIRTNGPGTGRWVLTTIGPAFGEPPFIPGKRLRLSTRVRCAGGTARVALALHRTGAPGLFDPSGYEEFVVEAPPAAEGWALLVVETPSIVPAPDRVHIRLTHTGEGASWFDNVLCEECD